MTDEQIEKLLRRYEFRAPDPGLKSRVLAVATEPLSTSLGVFDYRLLLAAAVLMLAAVLTAPMTRSVPANAADRAWRAEIDAAAATIGGDEQALRLAEMLVPKPESLNLEEETW